MAYSYKYSNEPLTSYGVICFRYNHFDINKFEIILIRRKDTIGYVEFLRGKYSIENKDYIIELLNLMTQYEKDKLINVRDFDKLREMLGMTKKSSAYKNEYEDAKAKFNVLLEDEQDGLDKLVLKSQTFWDTPEWEIPKGRRHNNEKNINCAVREFTEETGLVPNDFLIYPNIKPLEELYTGINKIKYRHVYYFAEFDSFKKLNLDINNKHQACEIGDINWFTYTNCMKILRPYHISKKNIIKKAFQILKSKQKYFKELIININ